MQINKRKMEVSGRKDFPYKGNETDILCQPCFGDGDNVPAEGYCETCNEYFCSSCLKVHRKQSMSKNHVIKSNDEMPNVQVQTDPSSEMCTVHKTEIVKFYCQGHDEVGCGDCMVVEHTSCRIQLVPDVSGDYYDSEDLKNIKLKIEQLEKAVSSQKGEIRKNLKAAEEMKKNVIKEIKLFRSELNNYLDRAEAELIKEIEELNAKDVSMQNKLEDECEQMENEIKEFQSKLNQYSDKMNQLFVTAKLAQKKLQTCQETAKRIASKGFVGSYTFEPTKDLTTLKTTQSSIGTLTISENKKLTAKNKRSIADRDALLVGQLNAKAAEDRDCNIKGLVMISRDEIVLTDECNWSIKILNIKENKITSQYRADFPPHGVALIKPGTVAVTITHYGKILFMNTIGQLSVSHSLQVESGCEGIDHKNDILAVTFCNPPAVRILNMEGHILHVCMPNHPFFFSYPAHNAFNNSNKSIYVSDHIMHEVFELTLDGQLLAIAKMRHEHLRFPRGLVVTSDGTVVVCGHGDSDIVGVILPQTRKIKRLSWKHVERSASLLVCEEQNKVFISSTLHSKDRNIIKVFELK